ncbi:MAG: Na+/H+ antiporter subunit D, partial [Candidatus Sumerlaeia bacterium]|nr:Na+/H+ antiporter subunit D [Candidatus Sumerlaeia bacterium]
MNLILLPIVLPMLGAVLCLLGRNNLGFQRLVAGLTTHATLAGSIYLLSRLLENGTQAVRVGDWPLTFGIVFVADVFAALMVMFGSLVHTATFWFMVASGTPDDEECTFLHPLFLLLGAGVNWAF